jgi:DNA recombination protein RmuC
MFSAIALVLLAVIVVLLIALLLRPRAVDSREDIARLRQLQIEDARALRDELLRYAMQTDQRGEALRASVTQQLDSVRTALDSRLEQIRLTVDEKLQSTLETRLGESFRLVSERLEQVHKGLG